MFAVHQTCKLTSSSTPLKDNKVFSYYKHKLEKDYPKDISAVFPGIPDHLDAAVECPKSDCPNDTVIFFRGIAGWYCLICQLQCARKGCWAFVSYDPLKVMRSTTLTCTPRRLTRRNSKACPTAQQPSVTWVIITASTDISSPSLTRWQEKSMANIQRRPVITSWGALTLVSVLRNVFGKMVELEQAF